MLEKDPFSEGVIADSFFPSFSNTKNNLRLFIKTKLGCLLQYLLSYILENWLMEI